MAGMCFGVNIAEADTTTTTTTSPMEVGSKISTRRQMDIHKFRFVANEIEKGRKRSHSRIEKRLDRLNHANKTLKSDSPTTVTIALSSSPVVKENSTQLSESVAVSDNQIVNELIDSGLPKFGMTSVCGRRRDMEDAVAIHPSFCKENNEISDSLHFFGVYDGHGCSHVAMKCKDRMHEIVRDEVEGGEKAAPWKELMVKSFTKMDKEVVDYSSAVAGGASSSSSCRCELQTPQCDAVGSTAVVALVTPDKLVVSNCGDSRAVLCRNGVAIPLSVDHKPDRPDELNRIQEAGGRVIYWDGPRVLGVLAMSRAIGDNYLKPYVISEPEVTITERSGEDECLILASDGLWDVVSNETACGVARMCLQSRRPPSPQGSPDNDVTVTGAGESSDKACSDASILLTKLALARGSTDNVSVVVVDLRKNV